MQEGPSTSNNPKPGVRGVQRTSVEVTKNRNFAELAEAIDISSLPCAKVDVSGETYVEAKEIYEEGLDIWKHSLIGRLDFKGLSFPNVKKTLATQWGFRENEFDIIALTKGYFDIKLNNDEHKRRVKYGGQWKLWHAESGRQTLKVQDWDDSFNPNLVKNSVAPVWCQYPNLRVSCLTEKMMLTLDKAMGTPVAVEKSTLQYDFRYPASVLVDVDFSLKVKDKVTVIIGEGKDITTEVVIPNRPKYCEHCCNLGHGYEDCPVLLKKMGFDKESVEKQSKNKKKI